MIMYIISSYFFGYYIILLLFTCITSAVAYTLCIFSTYFLREHLSSSLNQNKVYGFFVVTKHDVYDTRRR